MIAARFPAPVTSTSLMALIKSATPDQLTPLFTGRVCEIQLEWDGGLGTTANVLWKGGTTGAADIGYLLTENDVNLTFRSQTFNQLSLDDVYISEGVGPLHVRVVAYTM